MVWREAARCGTAAVVESRRQTGGIEAAGRQVVAAA